VKKDTTTTVGLDLGDRYSHLCVLDEAGDVVEEGKVMTRKEALRRRFESMAPCVVAMETGAHSRWVSELLSGMGHEVVVANARKLRAIYSNDNKCDEVDAEMLARLARSDKSLLSPIRHRSEEAQAVLAIVRARAVLVTARAKLINHVRGAVKSFGGRVPACDVEAFHRRAGEAVPEKLRPALAAVVGTVEAMTQTIREYDKQIEELVEKHAPEAKRLKTIYGVGALTALCFVLTIEEPQRFTNSRKVGSFLGLRPKRDQSGNSDPHLRITKAGDPYLRQLLVQCGHWVLSSHGKESDLQRWGLQIVARGGAQGKKRAVVAVARKLAVLMHRLWVTGEAYDPFHNSRTHTQESGEQAVA